jgi:hypothetical protein
MSDFPMECVQKRPRFLDERRRTDDGFVSEAEHCVFFIDLGDVLDDDDREVGQEKLTHSLIGLSLNLIYDENMSVNGTIDDI